MSASKGFKQVFMTGVVGAAALGCYLVSLSVASTRAELESVETRILLAQRDIRTLETEVGTRGRLAQLERWNTRFIRLSAPQADQFVEGAFQLATLTKPDEKSAIDAPVVLASAPAPDAKAPVLTNDSDQADTAAPRSLAPSDMMHVASYTVASAKTAPRAVTIDMAASARSAPSAPKPAAARPVAAAKPVAAATGTTAIKPAKTALADPLAPLPNAPAKAKAQSAKSKE